MSTQPDKPAAKVYNDSYFRGAQEERKQDAIEFHKILTDTGVFKNPLQAQPMASQALQASMISVMGKLSEFGGKLGSVDAA
eukprot:71063-Pyramimonas_sp.AAC.1